MSSSALGEKRRSRRWFLGATGIAVSTAAVGACGGGARLRPTPSSNAATVALQSPSPVRSATAASRGRQAGGTLRYTGFVLSNGVFDPQQAQPGPLTGEQSMVFSRLLSYTSQATQEIVPDLAVALPEQPDSQTLVFRLKPAARWPQQPPLDGRRLSAKDVQFSFERQQHGASAFPYSSRWANIDRIEPADDSTITFHFKSPLAPMVTYFADVTSFILPPEIAGSSAGFTADNQLGSGPFQWVDWQEGKFASVSRNPSWFGGTKPYLDGLVMNQPRDATGVEARLRVKALDAATVARPAADALRQALPQLDQTAQGKSLYYGMRFFLPGAPFNDQRVRTALSLAIDRQEMLQRFFYGSGQPNPWISWPVTKWTLPQSELATLPGYRAGTVGRDADVADARALLSAAGTPSGLTLYVLDQAETSIGLGTAIWADLKRYVGLDITVTPVPLAQLGKGLIRGSYPWVSAPDLGWIDLDDWVFPYFHSTGTRNSFALRDTSLDALLESQRSELDPARRQQIGYAIQRQLLTLNAGVNFVSESIITLLWPYVRNFPTDIEDGYQSRFVDCWLDSTDPAYLGR